MDLGDKLRQELESLATLRDELRVKANLGAKELRDMWQEAERKWDEIEAKREELGKASAESGREIATAARHLADSLRDAYTHIRSKL